MELFLISILLIRCLLLGRKAMTNLDSILKSRDITLPTKVLVVKAMVFPVVMYGCESWTIKKAEHQRIDAFELWCWRRLLRVPWTARRSNNSILKEISLNIHWKDWCWSWNSNTLALDVKNWLIGKDPDAGKDWGQEEKGTAEDKMVGWHHQLNGHEFANKGPSSRTYGFSSSHVWMWELDYKESWEELMLLNYGVGEDSWKSLGLQGDTNSPS